MAICVTTNGPHGDLPAFVLHMIGRLDWAGGNDLAVAGVEVLHRSCGPVHVCIDLGDVDEADGRGLLSVETLAEAIVAHHGQVCLSRISFAVFQALELAVTDTARADPDRHVLPLIDGDHRRAHQSSAAVPSASERKTTERVTVPATPS